MDGNNRFWQIAFGICKGEIDLCWSWWMSLLKECIGDNPNLLFIYDRHAAIALAVEEEFPLAFHAVCCRHLMVNLGLGNKKRKANMTYEITDWATNKVAKRRMKSATWAVNGVNAYQYEVSDGQYIREVNLQTGICGCRKWHFRARMGSRNSYNMVLGLTDCVHYVADWFKKSKYQATYSESIHSLGNMNMGNFRSLFKKLYSSSLMDTPQLGRPKKYKPCNTFAWRGDKIIRCCTDEH
ncbi:transposase, MuDR, MULE transposase domain protein [Tanacetum coccineum]|uniref:Transposase, MuDR, MULE transposase domain protein n=1 Tax=Tanacetum coccineum TaxID=301880 RepID=A0ABQ5HL61_9ASTR